MTRNIAELLRDMASSRGTHDAVVTGERVSTYAQLASRAGAFANRLSDAGVTPGDRVAILLERGGDAPAALFGVYATGAIAIVINERLRAHQVEHILADADARVLISSAEQLEQLGRPLDAQPQLLTTHDIGDHDTLEPIARVATDVAQIIYTSGSTGLPRGVMHTHGSIGAGVANTLAYLGMREDDRVLSLVSLSAVYGLNQLLCGVSAGATTIFENASFPADIATCLRRDEISIAASVPPLWLQLLSVPDFSAPLPHLRQMQNAGGHLPAEAVRLLRAAQPQASLYLQYGMTETWRGTYLPPHELDTHPDSMGRPIAGADILVLREDGAPCAAGEVGELVHSGDSIAAGYWRARDGAQVFREHPTQSGKRAVYSGDFVRRDASGLLYYVGRRDRLIKTLGNRVGPQEIEEALYASGDVAEAVAAGEPDAERGQRIVAWIVLKDGATKQRVARFCRGALPPYMQPSRFEVVTAIPKLASGKYDVNALLTRGPSAP